MKKILIVHGNFPGQFRNIAWRLGRDDGYSLYFITDKNVEECEEISGVEVRTMKKERKVNAGTHHYIRPCESNILAGQKVVKEIIKLVEEGFIPDIVITHAGMGLGLFIKDILPNSKHIGLFEWFFKAETAKYLIEDYTFDQQLLTRSRNLTILSELNSCDFAIVPTEWQKHQFPKEYWGKLRVIFEGINTKFFSPSKQINEDVNIIGEDMKEPVLIKSTEKILSYATRGMEPIRGFMEFVDGSINALKSNVVSRVIIGGRDRCAYSYRPKGELSWKELAIKKYKENEVWDKVTFTGLMDYGNYRQLLRRSDLHCYFTRPYVPSWSLFEAAAVGARLCISKGMATSNIITKESRVRWVDLDNQKNINEEILKGLGDETLMSELMDDHRLDNCLNEWLKVLEHCN